MPPQASSAALETSDAFAASMHWGTYRASKPDKRLSDTLDPLTALCSSFAAPRVLAAGPERRAHEPVHAADRQLVAEGVRGGPLLRVREVDPVRDRQPPEGRRGVRGAGAEGARARPGRAVPAGGEDRAEEDDGRRARHDVLAAEGDEPQPRAARAGAAVRRLRRRHGGARARQRRPPEGCVPQLRERHQGRDVRGRGGCAVRALGHRGGGSWQGARGGV
ncbi:uncharacterized protein B0H18DRAFT_12696 [Fomitopsis serialis]|uniref:uncharacterized protein n=1 Tax=Fomitopsis serialis TaxID=139415 RepID=UPI002008E3EA|nr:uncharacterized protein B0H18DRAFT_12696 [Neoantrodia serialis]KAH9938381.1 hypothetical protein B0H18DRAFT_12696 [Neoantrodia serialis]